MSGGVEMAKEPGAPLSMSGILGITQQQSSQSGWCVSFVVNGLLKGKPHCFVELHAKAMAGYSSTIHALALFMLLVNSY